jgi:hypothetical protein
MTTTSDTNVMLLDDGLFYVDLNCNYPPAFAPGFLQRRCYLGVTTPGGYECVGSFDRSASDGMWEDSIDVPYNPAADSDARLIGRFPKRLGAIVALWGSRHEAHCRHA